jgi:hypothetical protein
MSNSKGNAAAGMDWTGLLTDPDLAKNFGKLLKTYRDAPPERREEALLAAMQEIKSAASSPAAVPEVQNSGPVACVPKPTTNIPPFEPDIFRPNWGQDRRRHPRIKCFVAVELRVNEGDAPIWGNLSNTSLGGCQIEISANLVPSGARVEIGLWVASGKIWVKGFALNGVVTRAAAGGVVRIRFDGMNLSEKENLRQFLTHVQESARAASNEKSYLQLLK